MVIKMKERLISAIVALLIVVPLILLGGVFFQIGILIMSSLAYKEILDLKKSHKEYPTIMVMLGLFSLIIIILANNYDASIYHGITYQMLCLLIISLLVPIIFYKNDEYNSKDAFYLIGCILFLSLVFNLFIIIRNRGLDNFVFLLLIPMFNDIFAFLIGSRFGKRKMCERISPNKTWEGSGGGLVIGSILALVFYHIFIGNITFDIIYLTILLSCVGQIGDLVMSKIKRENNIKDFSNLMPGHGGILDRLDSVIFVFLTYVLLLAF